MICRSCGAIFEHSRAAGAQPLRCGACAPAWNRGYRPRFCLDCAAHIPRVPFTKGAKRCPICAQIAARRFKRAAHDRYVAKNPDLPVRRTRRWRADNPAKRRVQAVTDSNRRRARLRDGRSPGVTPEQWAEICEVFSRACAYCLRTDQKLERDHVTPLALGGLDTPENVVPACKRCNCSKHKNLLIIWGTRKSAA